MEDIASGRSLDGIFTGVGAVIHGKFQRQIVHTFGTFGAPVPPTS